MSWFLHHPATAPHLPETRYSTLYGKFASGGEPPSLKHIIMRERTCPPANVCYWIDEIAGYVAERDEAMILFELGAALLF